MTNNSRPDAGSENFEQKLRGALAGATEGLPDNPSRYDQTETRVRRGRRLVGAGIVAAAVVLVGAGIGIPQLLSGGPGGGKDGDTTVATDRDSVALSCPKPSGGPGTPKTSGRGSLVPEGAVAARFCEGLPDPKRAVPADSALTATTITQGADQLVAAVNRLGPVTAGEACPMDLGATYDLVLGYPDGREVVVSFEAFGCGTARSGDEYRDGARGLADLGVKLLRDQPGAPADLTCPTDGQRVGRPDGTAAGGEFAPAGATGARLCPRPESAQPGQPVSAEVSSVVLDKERAATVVSKLNQLPAADPNAMCTMEMGATYDLMLGYPDGRELRVTFEGYGCGFAKAGSKFRMNAGELANQIAGEADAQRLATPPDGPTVPECRVPEKLLPGDGGQRSQLYGALVRDPDTALPHQPAAGLLCRYSSSDGEDAKLTGQQPLTAAETRQLYAALNASAKDRVPTCDWQSYTGPVDIAMFTDRAGGQYELRLLRGTCATLFDANGVAKASPEVLALVDQVLG
jgi:hypothetical protein